MLTANEVMTLLATSVVAHVYNRAAGAKLPVVKLIRQTGGGIAIQQPGGERETHSDPEFVALRTNHLLGLAVPKNRPAKTKGRFTFTDKHRGGLHILFVTDANQCVVVWRRREEGSFGVETVWGTYWAVTEQGEIDGYEMSEAQRAWLEAHRAEVDAWEAQLIARGLHPNTGGTPTPSPRRYYVPVRTTRGTISKPVA